MLAPRRGAPRGRAFVKGQQPAPFPRTPGSIKGPRMSLSFFIYLHRAFAPPWDGLTRRERFRAALIVAGGELLSEASALAAGPSTRQRRTVLVVGAGLGGLATAYELAHVGYDVQVVEARPRVGGRVISFTD